MRLNSEIIPDSELSKLCFIDKHLREKAGAFSNTEIGVESLREATSTFLLSIILSNIVDVIDMNYIDMNFVDMTPYGRDIDSLS